MIVEAIAIIQNPLSDNWVIRLFFMLPIGLNTQKSETSGYP
ncbi:hypothetical protein SYNPCC7002_F0109 (plasmid) [Picosynechococcus sp. PCC 7002]|nr:hypothetical protein SYNPCC7002_F0109 [Picosynechococcus sp. PCC 7002]